MDAYMISGADVLEEGARQLLDEAIAATDDTGLPAPLEPVLSLRTPGRAVLEAAEQADLIVVGSRQQSAAGCLILGSTSIQIAHHAPCPVVVVPPGD
jgi:nucleotide-binding universal stress UspA family protein